MTRSKEIQTKPRRNFLLLEFSALSLVAFIIIGYIVVSAVQPALESFTLDNQKNTTVVFANKQATRVLTKDDFRAPVTDEQKERFKTLFIGNLDLRGVLRIFITDSLGTVIYAQPEEFIGSSLSDNIDVGFALSRRRATAHFEDITAGEQGALGVKEALIEAVPITFKGSEDVVGVVYIISRVGLIKKQIEDTQQDIATRVALGLFVLYGLLFMVVWRASRTIRHQSGELIAYAETLEKRVRQRTKDLEKSLGKQIKQAKELARLKDEFVFIAAHELRAPVTNLNWTVDAFLSRSKIKLDDKSELANLLQAMKKSAHQLADLVTDLLNVARLESGTVKISVHPTSLLALLQDLVAQFEGDAQKHGVTLVFNYDTKKEFPFVMSDSERLKEIFSNLLSNAIKYNKKGGRVEVSLVEKGAFLEATVSDNGVGVSEQDLEKFFTKFWRADQNIEGTGLGLWISKQLVERMGGKITVKSKKGAGTSLMASFPIAKQDGVGSDSKKGKT